MREREREKNTGRAQQSVVIPEDNSARDITGPDICASLSLQMVETREWWKEIEGEEDCVDDKSAGQKI